MPRNDKGDEGARMGGAGCLVEGPYSRLRGNDKGENCGNDKEKKAKKYVVLGGKHHDGKSFCVNVG